MALRWLPNLTPTETIPGLVFEEPEHHLMALPIRTLPQLSINLFSGGKHAGGQVPIQDVLIVPASAHTVDEALSMMFEIYQCAAELVRRKYGIRALTADEFFRVTRKVKGFHGMLTQGRNFLLTLVP